MKLVDIPYRSFFRLIDEQEIPYSNVLLKPNTPSINKTHVLVKDERGKEKYLPNQTEVEILDRISNF